MSETDRPRRRAVVVDGMLRSARTIGQFLRLGLDFDVLAEVSDVAIALESCGSSPPDLLVVDAAVFGEHRQAALTMLCQSCPQVRVVVVCDDLDQRSRHDLLQSGADAVVSKPVRLPELQQAVQHALDSPRQRAVAAAQSEAVYLPSNFRPDVLLVEDETVTKALLVSAVKKSGASLLGAAPTLSRAGALLAMARPWVLLLDVTLPDGDGLDWLAKLPAQQRPPTIVITSHADVHRVARAKAIGVARYLLKPVQPVEVVRQIQRAVDGVREQMHQASVSPVERPPFEAPADEETDDEA